jgi:hypothetical protein
MRLLSESLQGLLSKSVDFHWHGRPLRQRLVKSRGDIGPIHALASYTHIIQGFGVEARIQRGFCRRQQLIGGMGDLAWLDPATSQ